MNIFSQFLQSNRVKQLDAASLNDQKTNLFLLDVRQPEEFRQGHIPGAKLIPLDQLEGRLKELPRQGEIVCICHSGSRSSAAANLLASTGYQVANLRGGMLAWERARLPVSHENS